ncbi:unnamed protein product [Pleuronectes platessa]|uniref:Uncharacterized protein n=1 Tax=Pleuronectes platessa TaxID=8262 RepID=A0A9N7TV31_PLEPL|nr:unnamed protein product [Pleuronectes platessa]
MTGSWSRTCGLDRAAGLVECVGALWLSPAMEIWNHPPHPPTFSLRAGLRSVSSLPVARSQVLNPASPPPPAPQDLFYPIHVPRPFNLALCVSVLTRTICLGGARDTCTCWTPASASYLRSAAAHSYKHL